MTEQQITYTLTERTNEDALVAFLLKDGELEGYVVEVNDIDAEKDDLESLDVDLVLYDADHNQVDIEDGNINKEYFNSMFESLFNAYLKEALELQMKRVQEEQDEANEGEEGEE